MNYVCMHSTLVSITAIACLPPGYHFLFHNARFIVRGALKLKCKRILRNRGVNKFSQRTHFEMEVRRCYCSSALSRQRELCVVPQRCHFTT